MSTETLKLLPVGTEEIVKKIVQLGPTKFRKVSQYILEKTPDSTDLANVLSTKERERLLGDLQTDPESELAVFVSL